jgi:carbamate kinase
MKIVIALGGNALLERGQQPEAALQQRHARQAVEALAPLAAFHDLVITHGNGPQVGIMAEESTRDLSLHRPYPFDVLGAETQGMIGYWLLQALENALPGRRVASLICQTVVDPDDPAFDHPRKFVGPTYQEAGANSMAQMKGWTVAKDGSAWRRVVASPEPKEFVELASIESLLGEGTVVICAGGGGIPVVRDPSGTLRGVEAVIDKDLSSALLARQLDADALLLLTDVPAVQVGYGTQEAQFVGSTTVAELRSHTFATGSMGPKVDAICRFIEGGGRFAGIGMLSDAQEILAGTRGTRLEAMTVAR